MLKYNVNKFANGFFGIGAKDEVDFDFVITVKTDGAEKLLCFKDEYQASKFIARNDLDGDQAKLSAWFGRSGDFEVARNYDDETIYLGLEVYLFEPSRYYSSETEEVFMKSWYLIQDEVQFDMNWQNGTGYLDNAVRHQMPIGAMSKCVDNFGRKVILVGTRFGAIVVFQRYARDYNTFVYNAPREVEKLHLLDTRSLYPRDLTTVLGPWFDFSKNIGYHIENMAEILKGGE